MATVSCPDREEGREWRERRETQPAASVSLQLSPFFFSDPRDIGRKRSWPLGFFFFPLRFVKLSILTENPALPQHKSMGDSRWLSSGDVTLDSAVQYL